MSDHYCGLNRGVPGFADSDFVIGTSSGATDVELRIADAANLTRIDVIKILKAFQRRLEVGGLADLLPNSPI